MSNDLTQEGEGGGILSGFTIHALSPTPDFELSD
jgi:hypothetical protein